MSLGKLRCTKFVNRKRKEMWKILSHPMGTILQKAEKARLGINIQMRPSATPRAGAWETVLLARQWWGFAARWERRAASAATRSSSSRRGWRKRPATARVIIIQGNYFFFLNTEY
jgi:hypothetical protein